jgi:hypothetical protein
MPSTILVVDDDITSEEEGEIRGKEPGAVGYLMKPIRTRCSYRSGKRKARLAAGSPTSSSFWQPVSGCAWR